MPEPMKVMKFGGSSVGSPERIRSVASIVLDAAAKGRVIVVVSAFQGVTDQLLRCAHLAEKGDAGYQTAFRQIAKRHHLAVNALLTKQTRRRVAAELDARLKELNDVLRGISLLGDCPPRALDLTASFGERCSALVIAAHLNEVRRAESVDSRQFVVTDDQFTHASVLFDQTNRRTQAYFRQLARSRRERVVPVVTGFVGATEDGRTTTIGRNGSDYTAAILGAALRADSIEIWTDVNGILSADPRAVPSAFVLPHMTYEEAMELSYFGAKVLHPATIAPAIAKRIPICIKNTFNPAAPGTRISEKAERWEGVAKGITAVEDIALLTLRGIGMVGVPGTAERLFRALASHRVSVILISQASSEHTICFAVSAADLARARRAVGGEFRFELQNKLTSLDEKPNQTIVAIVGEGMRGTPGVSGKVFEALGRNNVNVAAIAQGASERNISFVVASGQRTRALNIVHEAFFEKRKKLAVIVIGVGEIGSALLRLLEQQGAYLSARGFDIRVCCVANSRRYVLDAGGLDLSRWRKTLAESPCGMHARRLAREVARLELTNAVLVDCTASPEIAAAYSEFVNANLHIVTPNKKANILPWEQYAALTELMKRRRKYFLYEANVGAGLPIISTLGDLIASGDEILKIEGILSGTLSYLFNCYDGAKPFSAVLRDAHDLGLTEPDPRDDLSGEDVARKLLIIARHLGLKLDMKDVRYESLVPFVLRKGAFSPSLFDRFGQVDSMMERKLEEARSRGCVLRYVGTLEGRIATAGLREFPQIHPFAGTKGSDNVIAMTTRRYSQTPLVVQGPGAGADVTAMGVFSDILKLLHYLP